VLTRATGSTACCSNPWAARSVLCRGEERNEEMSNFDQQGIMTGGGAAAVGCRFRPKRWLTCAWAGETASDAASKLDRSKLRWSKRRESPLPAEAAG